MRLPVTACFFLAPTLFTSPVAAQSFRGDIHAGVDSISSDGESEAGATYGLSLNVDLTRSDVIFGVQVDLDATDNRSCETGVLIAGDRACVEGNRDSAVSLRIGHKVGNASELYALLGYANARFDATYDGAGIRVSDRENADGVRGGVGAIFAVSRKLYVKAEYRYTNYEQGISRNQGVVGLGLRF